MSFNDNPNKQEPADIMEAANAITALNVALGADLAVTVDPSAMSQLRIRAANGADVTLHLLGYELEEFLTKFIQEKLALLESLGVATSGVLRQYQQAAEKALQARKEEGG